MDHSEALRTKAAERYLLGEMRPSDRDEYEEHFFGCMECAEEVQAAAAFIDNARDALASPGIGAIPANQIATASARRSSAWLNWFLRPAFAVPAMALLLLIAGYESAYVIPHMRSDLQNATAPQTLPVLSLLSANSRGGEVPQQTIPPNKPFGLFVEHSARPAILLLRL